MTALVWLRRDLRIRDNVALRAALEEAQEKGGRVVPVFCFDERLYGGRHASGPRTQFLLESLGELRDELRDRGGELFIRHGRPEVRALEARAGDEAPTSVHFAYDVSPFARKRGKRTHGAFAGAGLEVRSHGGLNAVDVRCIEIATAGQALHGLLPFHRNWEGIAAARDARGARRGPGAERAERGPVADPRGSRPGTGGVRPAARRRGGGAQAARRLPRLRHLGVLRQPRRARPGPHLSTVSVPPLRLRLARARSRSG